ncbi:MAG: MATE family efflux transporter, partial [Candidatus Rokubacteria bacterium]|nr:MATE family efflux transporter [Candidatus Rokubacteria bacterium]
MTSTVAVAPMSARTKRLLEAPVAPTLLRLAAPNVLVMVLQAVVATMDAVFVGWLGSDALAGVSLVYPLLMLMQTMSAGGMGGGVASAVARALGAGRRAEAQALAAHAVLIALVMGMLFTSGLLAGGPALYSAMGGTGATGTTAINAAKATTLAQVLSGATGDAAPTQQAA